MGPDRLPDGLTRHQLRSHRVNMEPFSAASIPSDGPGRPAEEVRVTPWGVRSTRSRTSTDRSTEGVRDKTPHFFPSQAPVSSPVGDVDVDAARPEADKDARDQHT